KFRQRLVENPKKLIQFHLADRKRRTQQKMVPVDTIRRAAARIYHEPAPQADRRKLRVSAHCRRERFPGALVLYQLDAHQQALAAHFADGAVLQQRAPAPEETL